MNQRAKGMTLANWLKFLHLAYSTLHQATDAHVPLQLLLDTLQLNIAEQDHSLPIITSSAHDQDGDFIPISELLLAVSTINPKGDHAQPVEWESVTQAVLWLFLHPSRNSAADQSILTDNSDLNFVKEKCLKTLSDHSAILDLASYRPQNSI